MVARTVRSSTAENDRDQYDEEKDASDQTDTPQRLSPQLVEVTGPVFPFGGVRGTHAPELPEGSKERLDFRLFSR